MGCCSCCQSKEGETLQRLPGRYCGGVVDSMWHFAKLYVSTLAVFMALDALWLGVLMSDFYKAELGSLARRQGDALTPIWWAVVAVYVILPLGIIWFVLPRVSDASPLSSAAVWGVLFGVITYGIYDLTNYETLDKWTLR